MKQRLKEDSGAGRQPILDHQGHCVGYCYSLYTVKAQTPNQHQMGTKLDLCVTTRHLCLGQKVAVEHTTQITANTQLAHTVRA